MKRGLTYDDILLVPKYSEVKSRSIINTNTLVSAEGKVSKVTRGCCTKRRFYDERQTGA